jgi:hypothetical protein
MFIVPEEEKLTADIVVAFTSTPSVPADDVSGAELQLKLSRLTNTNTPASAVSPLMNGTLLLLTESDG